MTTGLLILTIVVALALVLVMFPIDFSRFFPKSVKKKEWLLRSKIINEAFFLIDKREKQMFTTSLGELSCIIANKKDGFAVDTIYITFQKKDGTIFRVSEDEIDTTALYKDLEFFLSVDDVFILAMEIITDEKDVVMLWSSKEE